MTVAEHFNTSSAPVRILATDIDTKVLEKARKGVYTLDQVQAISPDRPQAFFSEGDPGKMSALPGSVPNCSG